MNSPNITSSQCDVVLTINITQQLDNSTAFDYGNAIDRVHDDIINALNAGARLYVPHYRKNFYCLWWDQDMNLLKAASIESNQVWKSACKPWQGPIFDKRQSFRLQYLNQIRFNQSLSKTTYSNNLHDALLQKKRQKLLGLLELEF